MCVSQTAKLLRQGVKPKLQWFSGDFQPLNSSGVSGKVQLSLLGDKLTVHVQAQGLTAGKQYTQTLRGLVSGVASVPAVAQADTNKDGVIELSEGVPYFGDIVQDLGPYPTADQNGKLNYLATFTVDPAKLGQLSGKDVLLQGLTENGVYDTTILAAEALLTSR